VSLPDAARAAEEFVKIIDEAQDMVTAGAIGDVLDELLRHAKELLDVMDEELRDVDHDEHAELFAAAPLLRQKLERLRNELRGGSVN
jgi:hypothetical protein